MIKAATVSEVKKELQLLSPNKLVELCLALAKYKKDNKEFLSYLLFESHDKAAFVLSVKEVIDEHFSELRRDMNLYHAKKSLRKILRIIGRYSKYLGDKGSSAELYIYFLKQVRSSGIPYSRSQQLANMYEQQLKKINKVIEGIHEDLQNDYRRELEEL
jgi:hypothetical protein